MKTLFKICLISLIWGCGKPIDKVGNSYKAKDFYTDNNNQITLLDISSITSKYGDIEFKNTKTSLRKKALKELKSNNFYHSSTGFQPLPEVAFLISSYDDNEIIKIKIDSAYKLCSLDLKIDNQENYLEKSINRDELISNEFYLDIDTNKKITISFIDYKYCNSKQSLKEKLTQLKKDNYLIHFEKDNKQHIRAFQHESLLGTSLQLLDQNLKVHHDQEIISFMGKKNHRRISPLNDHLDNDLFWLFLGVDKGSLNQNISKGKIINLFHFSMSEIRSSITNNVYINIENNQINLDKYGDSRIKILGYYLTLYDYNYWSDDIRVKCKFRGIGWGKCKMKEFKVQLKQADTKYYNLEDAKKRFSILFDEELNLSLRPLTKEYFVGLSCGAICAALKFYINPYNGAKQLTDSAPQRFETQKLKQVHFEVEAMIL